MSQTQQPLIDLYNFSRPVPDNRAYAAAPGRSRGRNAPTRNAPTRNGATMPRAGTPGSHIYKTDEARTWEASIWADVVDWRARHGYHAAGPMPGFEHGVRIRATVFGVRGDATNYLKVLCDGLKRGLGIDDVHFTDVQAVKEPARRGVQGVHIEIWPAEPRTGGAA